MDPSIVMAAAAAVRALRAEMHAEAPSLFDLKVSRGDVEVTPEVKAAVASRRALWSELSSIQARYIAILREQVKSSPA